jgi:hypothetical protein
VISPTVTSVSIEELEVELSGNIPHTFYGPVAKFNKTLAPGYNYTLIVELKETRWAGSNIYLDDNHGLRFDKAGNRAKEAFQGVFFKWGSLVGIAPGTEFSDTDTDLYYSIDHEQYDLFNDSWDNIPYIDPEAEHLSSDDRTNMKIIAPEWNTPEIWGQRKGDICQYLGSLNIGLEGYRLPTSAEFGLYDRPEEQPPWWSEYPGEIRCGYAAVPGLYGDMEYPGELNASGITPLTDCFGVINVATNGFFPAAGQYVLMYVGDPYRMEGEGQGGYYWSGSVGPYDYANVPLAYALFFSSHDVLPYEWAPPHLGFSVRCIKRLPGELP